jgi:tRNA (guanosine-2'-O-)-methyltransferase
MGKKRPLEKHWDGDWNKTAQIQAARQQNIAMVLEDLYQPHNAHSIVRTCDGFGIGKLRIIERNNRFRIEQEEIQRLAKTFDFRIYPNQPPLDPTEACLKDLKSQGFKIAVTTLRPDCIDLETLRSREPKDAKLAFVFGTEEHGLSEIGHSYADYFLKLPMYGMTQSFNVSVSVALVARNYLGWPPANYRKESYRD